MNGHLHPNLAQRSLREALRTVRQESGEFDYKREMIGTLYDRARAMYDQLPAETRKTLWLTNFERVAIAVVVALLAIATSAAAADLFVTPAFPVPGSSVSMGLHYLLAVRTLPGALCSVDVEIPGRTKTTHAAATKADAGGAASWRAYTTSDPGDRHATATCEIDGRRVTAEWTYTVR